MKIKLLAIYVFVSMMTGCATWNHPNSNPQKFANDKLECQALANRMYSGFIPNLQAFNTCMEGKGYTKQ